MSVCSPSPCLLTHCTGCCGRYLAKLSSVGSISEEETCEKLKGLIQRQVQMCKRNLEVMDSVRRGAQLAIEECQYQFRNRRWNCSTLDTLPVFGKVVTQGEPGTHTWGAAAQGRSTNSPAGSFGLQGGLGFHLPPSQQLQSREQPCTWSWGSQPFPGHCSKALQTVLAAAYRGPCGSSIAGWLLC